MDYGKFKYESALKARESRKNQTQTVIKEIKLRPKIDPHDYGTKKGHVERFLKAGDKVKVTIMFRGREQSRPELGFRLLQRLAGDVDELGFVEAQPKQDGRNMTMVIGPHRRKSDAKADRPVHQQAERSHPERPERSPQTERGPRTQPVQAQPAEAEPVQAQPVQAQPVQAQPAQAQASRSRLSPSRPSPSRLSPGPGPGPGPSPGPGPARPGSARRRPAGPGPACSGAACSGQARTGQACGSPACGSPARSGQADAAACGPCARPAGSRPARRARRRGVRGPAGREQRAGDQAARPGSLGQLTGRLPNA